MKKVEASFIIQNHECNYRPESSETVQTAENIIFYGSQLPIIHRRFTAVKEKALLDNL